MATHARVRAAQNANAHQFCRPPPSLPPSHHPCLEKKEPPFLFCTHPKAARACSQRGDALRRPPLYAASYIQRERAREALPHLTNTCPRGRALTNFMPPPPHAAAPSGTMAAHVGAAGFFSTLSIFPRVFEFPNDFATHTHYSLRERFGTFPKLMITGLAWRPNGARALFSPPPPAQKYERVSIQLARTLKKPQAVFWLLFSQFAGARRFESQNQGRAI